MADPEAKQMSDPTKNTNVHRVTQAPFQITSNQEERSRWLKLLAYGKPGVGKTELLASSVNVPEMRDVLMIDAESGRETLEDNDRIPDQERLAHVRVTTFKQVAQVHDYLKAHVKVRDMPEGPERTKKLKILTAAITSQPIEEIDEPFEFRTVIIDSLTEVDAYCMYNIMGMDTEKIETDDEMAVPEFKDFRRNNEQVKLLIRAFRDLPINLLIACAQQYSQDELKKFHYTPALTGKLSSQVQGFMDIVGYMVTQAANETSEMPRKLIIAPLQSGASFDAKNRKSIYKKTSFDNPDMLKIMRAIKLAK